MDYSLICRTCLRSDNLKPIFTNKDDHETYTNIIYNIAGIKITHDDNMPQNMCSDCLNILNDILRFCKQCKDADTKLRSSFTEKNTNIFEKFCNKGIKDKIYDLKIKNEFDDDSISNTVLNPNNVVLIEFQDNDMETNESLHYFETVYASKCDVDIFKTDTELGKPDAHSKISIKTKSKMKPIKKILKNGMINKSNIQMSIFESKLNNMEVFLKDKTNNTNQSYYNTEIVDEVENYSNASEIPYEMIKDPITEKVSKVFCKLCNKEFSARSIHNHMVNKHPGADKRKVKCDLCDNYINKEKMNRHKIMMHGNDSFRCGYCKIDFNSKENLVNHVTNCTSRKRKRYISYSGRELLECDICCKVMQKASLRMHKAIKHAGLKPACEHCGKSFGSKFRLQEHFRAKHGYEKLKCSFCDFKSSGVMAMRNHERRHRGEKPFTCEICGAKFHAAYLLTQHRHSHRTEKLVKCELCPASFKSNNSLHMHKLTCHSSSMYKCTVCQRSYKCRHYAVKHVRHVHGYSGPTPPLAMLTKEELAKLTNS